MRQDFVIDCKCLVGDLLVPTTSLDAVDVLATDSSFVPEGSITVASEDYFSSSVLLTNGLLAEFSTTSK